MSLDSLPEMSFLLDTMDIGNMLHGTKKNLVIPFTNTGESDLLIELATACKCIDISWTTEPVPPQGQGMIRVVFDSTGFWGEVIKTIDIIANTEPIVVETWFKVNIVKEEKND